MKVETENTEQTLEELLGKFNDEKTHFMILKFN